MSGRGVTTRFSAAQMAALNDAVRPRLADVYDRCAPLLSTRGQRIVNRALTNGTVGGDVGMQLLFEPATLLGLVADGDTVYELADVARSIPFIGDYGLWAPCESVIAAAYRVLMIGGDSRTGEVRSWLSLPANGGAAGPPVVHEAMMNRLNGLLVEQIRSDDYACPLKLAELAYVIAKLRELSVMWAFGGSPSWPRERIDDEIAAVKDQLAEFLVTP
ncbi:hypothetical protein MTY66_61630 (plasmid) [Mycolicibacterium sp. TY66]|nr:hypothetical protein MTY66_61630 [Mycolicibacterium sp. TY66]BCJ84768.1 hypothetical protein MTY81_61410 [Mycolicibacterium sp. TY81]